MRDCFILLKQSSIFFKKIYKFFKKNNNFKDKKQ